jgi:hypothetical protein
MTDLCLLNFRDCTPSALTEEPSSYMLHMFNNSGIYIIYYMHNTMQALSPKG